MPGHAHRTRGTAERTAAAATWGFQLDYSTVNGVKKGFVRVEWGVPTMSLM